MNIDELQKKIDSEIRLLKTWEDWEKLEEKLFKCSQWEESDIEITELNSEIEIEGIKWNNISYPYKISPEIRHIYETTSSRVFAILEPTIEKENMKHPEFYGKVCYYDNIFTRKFETLKCPICCRDLLTYPLNEWD